MCDTGTVAHSRYVVVTDGGGGDAILGGSSGQVSASQLATRTDQGSDVQTAESGSAYWEGGRVTEIKECHSEAGCLADRRYAADHTYRSGSVGDNLAVGAPDSHALDNCATGQLTDNDGGYGRYVCGANCEENCTDVDIHDDRDVHEDDSCVRGHGTGLYRDVVDCLSDENDDEFCVVDIGTDDFDNNDDTRLPDANLGCHNNDGNVCMVSVITDDEYDDESDVDGNLCVYNIGICNANTYFESSHPRVNDTKDNPGEVYGSVYKRGRGTNKYDDDINERKDDAGVNDIRKCRSSQYQGSEDSGPDAETKREQKDGKVEVVKKKKKHKEKDEKKDKKGKSSKKSKKRKKDKKHKTGGKDKDDKAAPKGDGGPHVKIFQEEARTIVGSSNKIPRSCDPSFLRACPRTIKLIELAFDALLIIAASSPRCHQGIYHLKIISVTLIAFVIVLTGVVLVLFLRAVPGRCPASCRCLHQQLAYCIFCLSVIVSVGTFHAIYWCDLGRKITVGCAGLSTIIHFIDLLLSIAMLFDHKKLIARDRKRLERKAQPMVKATAGKKK